MDQAYTDTGIDPSEPVDYWYLDKTGMTWAEMMQEPQRVRSARMDWYLARENAQRPNGDG